MLDNVYVKDVYLNIDDYPNISQDAPIGHAMHMMHSFLEDQHKYRNILVLDDDDHLKGYLSLRDLIRAVGPGYLRKRAPNLKGNQPFNFEGHEQDLTALSSMWEEGFSNKIYDELHKPVSECMTLMEDHVSVDEHIAKCIYLMLARDVLILPVVEDERVIGVIRLVDVFERIADSVEKKWLPKQDKG